MSVNGGRCPPLAAEGTGVMLIRAGLALEGEGHRTGKKTAFFILTRFLKFYTAYFK
jgi:hypothetical protein